MLSIIIPLYILDDTLKALTQKCLNSLRMTTRGAYELILVDNASPIQLRAKPDIFIKRKVNGGNARAWNDGLALSRGDKILLCDNDVEFPKGWEAILEDVIDDQIVFPRTWCREENEPTEKLSGFFWLMNRNTFNKLGYVSEDYGLANFEDTDYFFLAQKNGVKLKCIDKTTIKHYGRATCDKVAWVKDNYDRNEKLYIEKHGYNFPYLN